MEPKKPDSESNLKEKENQSDSKPTNTENCPQDPKQKGLAPKCQGCPFRAQCMAAQSQGPSIDEQVKEKLVNVKNIILVLSGKGGVGKSYMWPKYTENDGNRNRRNKRVSTRYGTCIQRTKFSNNVNRIYDKR